RRQAAQGELMNACARLDSCGADADLIALAKRCLAARKEDRPRQAGDVARAMERYQELVRERLRTAELEREKARVQAEEDRKRRQVEEARAAAEQARADEEQKRRQAEQARADEEERRRQVEQGKVHEERRRRRVQLYLGAAVVALVLGGSGAGLWYQQYRA